MYIFLHKQEKNNNTAWMNVQPSRRSLLILWLVQTLQWVKLSQNIQQKANEKAKITAMQKEK